ncbi:hypothetical protein F2P81_016133 [Scophthalmus maximus]|uniref:Uncharacterized protein n=1 Tax=Scophthalmus maximus TaxID=52904 RepID=A0A6A4SH90_SCOMX|nr:hypothetical protein F2P81_016133 [Scophthalmus maximus]
MRRSSETGGLNSRGGLGSNSGDLILAGNLTDGGGELDEARQHKPGAHRNYAIQKEAQGYSCSQVDRMTPENDEMMSLCAELCPKIQPKVAV